MPLTVSINLQVPKLPENDVWFANSAAWSNYWASIGLAAVFDPDNNAVYAETAYDNTQQSLNIQYGDVTYTAASTSQFNSLLAAYQALNASYKQLRADLVAIGIILNP